MDRCGSVSATATVAPDSWRAAAIPAAIVLLPGPPFWFAIASILIPTHLLDSYSFQHLRFSAT